MTGSHFERTSHQKPARSTEKEAEPPLDSEQDRRRRFAKSLTRNVFGRHYWDDALEAEKQNASRKGR